MRFHAAGEESTHEIHESNEPNVAVGDHSSQWDFAEFLEFEGNFAGGRSEESGKSKYYRSRYLRLRWSASNCLQRFGRVLRLKEWVIRSNCWLKRYLAGYAGSGSILPRNQLGFRFGRQNAGLGAEQMIALEFGVIDADG